MKESLLALVILITSHLMAQPDSLPSGVYSWNNTKAKIVEGRARKQMLNGSTLDLANLEIHTSTLGPWQSPHPPHVHSDYEKLIIVKAGRLKVTIKDSSKILGAGGIALVIVGDEHSFQNAWDKPTTYYILKFKSKAPVNVQRGSKAGGSVVKDWSEMMMKKTDKGERREIFDKPSSMFGRFEMHATALNPNFASHDPHVHRAEEIILMIKGNVTMQIGQTFHKVTAGDVIFLASGDLHAAKNTGTEQCGYFAIQWLN